MKDLPLVLTICLTSLSAQADVNGDGMKSIAEVMAKLTLKPNSDKPVLKDFIGDRPGDPATAKCDITVAYIPKGVARTIPKDHFLSPGLWVFDTTHPDFANRYFHIAPDSTEIAKHNGKKLTLNGAKFQKAKIHRTLGAGRVADAR